MAGRLVLSTLNDDTGILATQNGMSGIAKAWVNYKGTSPQSIRASFNVSSVTYNSASSYTINFTNAFADTNYAAVGSCSYTGTGSGSWVGTSTFNTGSCAIQATSTGSAGDATFVSVAFFR